MDKKQKQHRPKARLPKGFTDIESHEIRTMEQMLTTVQGVYRHYGFEPFDTPALEYSDALGKFLPDQDRPNEGVFSFADEDGQWLSLRYDLTAPLARYVALHYDGLPKPFRRYQSGPVWRNEKPGPGRFRQFMQCDADTVGTESVAADAELCMLAVDCLEALGIPRRSYKINLNNRKLLDAVLETIGIHPEEAASRSTRLTILRAIDKLDRLGLGGVEQLLGEGRKDQSGDVTRGAGLEKALRTKILDFVNAGQDGRSETLAAIEELLVGSSLGREGMDELREMDMLLSAAGFHSDQIAVAPAIVRGLDYYTGPVFEAELTFESKDEEGEAVRFGSVGGGGRYDGLVARFKGIAVPATGFSIGLSRLCAARKDLGLAAGEVCPAPVIVLVMDRDHLADYQKMATELRQAGIRAEMYVGTSGMKAQMKYADKRGAPCVIIQGEEEREGREITIKDLIKGAQMSEKIADNKEWRKGQPAQFRVKEENMIEAVRTVIAAQQKSALSKG